MTIPVRVDWSLAEAIAEAKATNWNPSQFGLSDTGGIDRPTALQWAHSGSESLVAASDAYLSELESVLPETGRARWTHDIAGAFPNVPRYLAGADPRVMRRKRLFQEDRAPIRIYVEMGCSAAIDARNYAKRGTAILALLRAAEQVRPVELYAAKVTLGKQSLPCDTVTFTVRLPTGPLNVSLAAAWLSHVAIFRRCFIMRSQSFFHTSLYYTPITKDAPKVKELLGLGPSDLYIPGLRSDDAILTNPVQWIKDRLAEIGANAED